MQKFKVPFWYEIRGTAFIEAKTLKSAEKRVYKDLDEIGIDDLSYRINDRDYGTCEAELV